MAAIGIALGVAALILSLAALSGFQRRIAGNRDIGSIFVAAADGVATSDVQTEIEAILRETRRIAPGADDNFEIRDMTQIADAMASATTTMTGMLGAVAGVSLLVGGIGIMNIMLVSVTERTREIGIRLAIGAHERHILVQFLVALAFATPIYAFSAGLKDESPFAIVFRLGMIPLFLFSGAFFPIENLDPWMEALARATPLWHGVDLTRMLTLDTVDAGTALVHVAYLVVLATLGWFWAVARLTRRMSF